jgi:hypothetical protein
MSATKIYNYNLIMALTYRERERSFKKQYAKFYFKIFQKFKYFFKKSIIFNHFLKEEYKRPTIYATTNRLSITQSHQDRKITG